MRAIAAIAVLLLTLPAWGDAPAADRARAREWFHTGQQHFELGEFADALHDFKEAYRLYDEPTFLFNIGQCHRALDEKVEAVRSFKVYLQKSPNAPNRVEVKEMIVKLEQAIADEPKPAVKPEAKPEMAPVPSPQPVTLAPSPQPVAAPTPVEKPIYKRWWLWTAVAAVVVVGVGIGLGVGLSSSNTPTANTDFGIYKPY
jgi:tetratricopeptide (TPR) repeat protein